jgi:hypothetical protein
VCRYYIFIGLYHNMIYNTLYIVYNRLPNIHVRQCIFNAGVVLYIVCREIY